MVQSAMQSGYGFGVWVGLLTALGIEICPVYPSVWKKASGLNGKDKVWTSPRVKRKYNKIDRAKL
jgi:hypothetical protein